MTFHIVGSVLTMGAHYKVGIIRMNPGYRRPDKNVDNNDRPHSDRSDNVGDIALQIR